jgi:anti-sigma factor RsiW
MMPELNTHVSDEKLLLYVDGEIRGREEGDIREHLAACWSCRLRMRELDDAIAEVARMHRQAVDPPLPPADGPRALLRARLRELASAGPNSAMRVTFHQLTGAAALVAAVGVVLAVIWVGGLSREPKEIPRSDLTPGAVRNVAVRDVCRADLSSNGEVLPVIQRQVFAEYGMPNAETRAYEVDYLITPALGGSDDIRNLWPQPYAGSRWNAYVKDALEDYLRRMVCNGQLDLGTAQHEIASNWVAAYQKYFHTRRPLPQHQRMRHDAGPE